MGRHENPIATVIDGHIAKKIRIEDGGKLWLTKQSILAGGSTG
jgi:hypothetical protein